MPDGRPRVDGRGTPQNPLAGLQGDEPLFQSDVYRSVGHGEEVNRCRRRRQRIDLKFLVVVVDRRHRIADTSSVLEEPHIFDAQESAAIMRLGQLRRDIDLLLDIQNRRFDPHLLTDFDEIAQECGRVGKDIAAFVASRRVKVAVPKKIAPRKSIWN